VAIEMKDSNNITYSDFYDISEYLNIKLKGGYTAREIAENAFIYKESYDESKRNGNPNSIMKDLCYLIAQDLGWFNDNRNIDVDTMDALLFALISGDE
jgi:hypothetical protein